MVMYLVLDDVTNFLNSPIGLLLVGSLVSGVIVQFIVMWYTDRQTRLHKQVEAQFELLDAINRAVAKILSRSQELAACYQKRVGREQLASETEAYNDAEFEWEVDARGFWLQLRVYFNTELIVRKWDTIKKERDALDVTIYELSTGQATPDQCLQKIERISSDAAELCQMMYARIGKGQK